MAPAGWAGSELVGGAQVGCGTAPVGGKAGRGGGAGRGV